MQSRKFSLPSLLSLSLIITLAVVLVGTVLMPLSKVSALSGSDFNAGHIIDDYVFTDSTAMSANDIQNFLNAKLPSCDTNGSLTKSYYYNATTGRVNNSSDTFVTTSRAVYGQRYDSYEGTGIAAAPYTCLKNYVENPATHQNNLQNPGASIPGGESAAQIIAIAAQTYQINPEVLLVTLQKEQGLVTDDWPWTNEYQIATGYACPDSGSCDSAYYGFYNQVSNAASQYRNYLNNPNRFNYTVGNNFILYNPNSACGGTTVNIQNQATAALYDYTPYQPNAAALSNLTGTGDGCSAYGNRNFWYYFTTWFGTTYNPSYSWAYAGQGAFTDSSKSTPVDTTQLAPGQRVYLTLSAKNIGNTAWVNNGPIPMSLGTDLPQNRTSTVCDSTWITCARPAVMNESTVLPGQTATFGFWIKAPSTPGNYKEYFNLVSENNTWLNDIGLNYAIGVKPPYSWSYAGQNQYTDSSKTTVQPTSIIAGQRAYLTLSAVNNGTSTWTNTGANPVTLGTDLSMNRLSSFCDSTWISCARPAVMNESSVAPGQTGTFSFWIKAPPQAGNYKEYFNLVSENNTWLNDLGLNYLYNVVPQNYSWAYKGQGAFTDSSKSTPVDTTQLTAGQRVYLTLSAQNTGNMTWVNTGSNPLTLGTDLPLNRVSAICDSTWINCGRPAVMNESSVAPGQTATFGFWIKAPAKAGTYKEYFNLLSENNTWLNDIGLNYAITSH